MKKYVIGEVLDNNTQNRSKKWGYRVGRKCFIQLLEIGRPMVILYPESMGVFRTSIVKEIDQTDYGFWIKTLNSHYRLDEI